MKKEKLNLPVVEEPFSLKDLKFSFNLADADYQIDVLQNMLLQTYLRADPRFRRAFSNNYTSYLLQYIKDKARLREPLHISTIGNTRSGKSFSMIGLATYIMACYGKKFTIEYVCANAFEFLEKIKTMPQEKLVNSCFLVDEEKQTLYGTGSLAKKMKLTDVQNIIAINNISTIMLNPNSWANREANYGLRTFGRCFKTKTCRMMLYNLQEKGRGGELPMGCIYFPIFTSFLPKEYAEELEKQYLEKKNAWVLDEQRGSGDVLYEMKRKSAESFCRDKKYLELKKRAEKETYISVILGSEWTRGEIKEIFELTRLIDKGVFDKDE